MGSRDSGAKPKRGTTNVQADEALVGMGKPGRGWELELTAKINMGFATSPARRAPGGELQSLGGESVAC